MLTGADNASVAVESIKLGAQDYVVKDPNLQYLELLPSVIQRVLREVLAQKEKTEMEVSLARAEAKFRFLVEQIPAITYSTAADASGELLYISPQITQLGYTPDELLADTEGILRLLHPEDKALAYSQIARSYESGDPLRCECRLLTRSGEVRWFLNEASMVRHELNEPLFLQGILIDITRDKEVEEELQQHRRRLEELVASRTIQFEKKIEILKSANANLTIELGTCMQSKSEVRKYADQLSEFCLSAPCGYCSLDRDGVFAKVNDTMLGWLERTREELVGKIRFSDLLTPESDKLLKEKYKQFKDRDTIRDLEIEMIRRDGKKFTVLLITKVIKDGYGHLVMSHSMMFDITSRVRAG
jgi:PAS domain S-box-containing protein